MAKIYHELSDTIVKEGDNKTAWLRCTSTPPGMRYTDIEQIKCKMEQRYSIDNTSNNAWHLLSCNPSLWQNSDYDSQESTVDYFYSNVSVTQLDFSHIIHRILDDMNFLINQKSERKLLIENFHKTVANEIYGNQGVIYHYLIPHQLVNDIAYISKEIWYFRHG